MRYCYKGKQSPNIITHEEFQKVVKFIIEERDSCSDIWYSKFCKIKWIMQLYFIYYLGLRPNEARLIELKHVDLEKKTIYIPSKNAKTKNDDIVPIPNFIYGPLVRFMRLRQLYFHGNPYLFSSKSRKGITDRNYLSLKFRLILLKIGISKVTYVDILNKKRKNKNLYSLRHAFGARVWESTHDLIKTANALRHHDDSFRTAMVYSHINEDEMREDTFKEIYPSKEI